MGVLLAEEVPEELLPNEKDLEGTMDGLLRVQEGLLDKLFAIK